MYGLFNRWIARIHLRLNRWLTGFVDFSGSHEIVRIVTRSIGLSWVDMENHVLVKNRYILPYRIEEIRLTYYNDAMQNVGYMHFTGPVTIGPFASRQIVMPSKMSNITALFNGVRMLLTDHIKTRTVGTTTIRLLGIRFELPVDDILIIEKSKITTPEIDEEERRQREEASRQRKLKREAVRAERQARRQARREEQALAREVRKQRRESGNPLTDTETRPETPGDTVTPT